MSDDLTGYQRICPEDNLEILLPASHVPDGATVRKLTGAYEYRLRRELLLHVYNQESKGLEQMRIGGVFLLNDRGDITQIPPDKRILWIVTAEVFVEGLDKSWDPDDIR